MAAPSFPTTFAAVLSPFLIWAAHFGVVYGVNGLACERGLAKLSLLGYSLVPALVTGATAAALLLAAAVLVRALRGWPAAHLADPEPRRFLRWFTAWSAAAAALAILWVGLPVIQVPACG